MKTDNLLPRVSIEISPELKEDLNKTLRYGELTLLVKKFLERLVALCEKNGRDVVIQQILKEGKE